MCIYVCQRTREKRQAERHNKIQRKYPGQTCYRHAKISKIKKNRRETIKLVKEHKETDRQTEPQPYRHKDEHIKRRSERHQTTEGSTSI